jgi:hypothetical protein
MPTPGMTSGIHVCWHLEKKAVRRRTNNDTAQGSEVLLQQQISKSGHPKSRSISFRPTTAICCFPCAAGSQAFARCQASLR